MTILLQSLSIYIGSALVLLAIYYLSPVIYPFLISFILAYLGKPIVSWLEEKGLGRLTAVILVFAIIFTVLALAITFLMPLIIEQLKALTGLPSKIVQYFQYDFWQVLQRNLPPEVGIKPQDVKETVENAHEQVSQQTSSKIIEGFWTSASWILNFLINATLVPIITFYFMKDWPAMIVAIRKLIPRRRRPAITKLMEEANENLSSLIRGQFIVMNILAAIYAVGLMALGVHYAIIIALVAGYLNFIPYFGLLVGAGIALGVTVVQFSDIYHPAMVAGLFLVAQIIEGSFLTPKLVGDRIGLHPVTVIFAVMAGGQLLGMTGVLLALPIAVILKVLIRFWINSDESPELNGEKEDDETQAAVDAKPIS